MAAANDIKAIEAFILKTMVAHYKQCPIPWPTNEVAGYPEDYDGYHLAQAYNEFCKTIHITPEFDWNDELVILPEFKEIWFQFRKNWFTDVFWAAKQTP